VFFEPVETKKRVTTGSQDGEAGADEADVDFGSAPGGSVDVRVRKVAAERDFNQASWGAGEAADGEDEDYGVLFSN